MGRYVIRRLLQAVLTIFLALFLLHYLTSLSIQINGNPAYAFFGGQITPTQEQLRVVAERYHTDHPCLKRVGDPCLSNFMDTLGRYANGDFGQDLRFRPVSDQVVMRVPNTLRVFAINIATWAIAGIGLGMLAAVRREKFSDYLIRAGTIISGAVPTFLFVLALKYLAGVWIGGWLRDHLGDDNVLSIIFRPSWDEAHPWLTVILPGIALAVIGTAGITRLMRTSMLENIRSDHVRTAKAKGLTGGRVLLAHTLRNSLIPVVTLIGLSLGGALGGAVITEGLWNIRGVGQFVFNAVRQNDTPIVVGVVSLVVICYLLFSLLIDLLYAVLDPRIRYE
ncbi:putative dipeptide-transport integral membrane protein ABC transporter DppB [Actinorhabdospora filicis]|uniref:Dipeptide-transport integral membrane protein ABC transporter DppB n=1 Tax=Actinorhabdospora filicis TaxID=1785913 RepID=A0A9W6SSN5_9ACTN|nr:ABC transporter permease [Actinorhabdospora filicis]GLZ80021.1 putative dipeptide-transport integral membrane protein ABC transporter DppB [Actinorhabdospora filicis]